MKKDEEARRISIDESEIHLLKLIEDGYRTIELFHETEEPVDENTITYYLSQVEGIEKVKSLFIDYSSNLTNLEIIKAMPGLEMVFVSGYNIKTLKGLEYFKDGIYLSVITDKNKKRDIADISQSSITSLTLQYKKEEDFDAITTCKSLRDLELGSSPAPPFGEWSDLRLEQLKISRGKFVELADTASVKQLKDLMLINCRKFEKFVGDNSEITWLLVDGSTHLDLKTINTCTNIEHVCINTNHNEIALSDFYGMKRLKSLKFIRCKVNVDIMNLREAMPNLEKIFIDNINKELNQELTRMNTGISFSW